MSDGRTGIIGPIEDYSDSDLAVVKRKLYAEINGLTRDLDLVLDEIDRREAAEEAEVDGACWAEEQRQGNLFGRNVL